jgi:hypothetical protein
MSNTVFISYPHTDTDQEWVEGFSRSLQDRGFNVWLDRWQHRTGESLREAIEKGLRESDTIVWVVNKDNVRSPNTLFELGLAVGMGKKGAVIVSNELDPALVPGILRSKRLLKRQSPEETANAFAEASHNATEKGG